MSDKKVPHPGDIFGHEAANVASVRALYPAQFSGPFNNWGWPDGWHSIVLEVCAFAAHHRPETRWLQIKEKYGSLRMYYAGGGFRVDLRASEGLASALMPGRGAQPAAEFKDIVVRAEARSLKTCSLCGTHEEAARVERRSFCNWLITSCERCVPVITEYRVTIRGPTGSDAGTPTA